MEQYLNLNLLTQNGILENEFHFQLLIIILFLYFFLISTFTLLLIKHSIYSSKKKLSVFKPKFKNRRSEKPSSTNPEDDFWRKFYNLLKILGAGIVIVGIIYVIYEFGGDSGSNPSMDPGASSRDAPDTAKKKIYTKEYYATLGQMIDLILQRHQEYAPHLAARMVLLDSGTLTQADFDIWTKPFLDNIQKLETLMHQFKNGEIDIALYEEMKIKLQTDWDSCIATANLSEKRPI